MIKFQNPWIVILLFTGLNLFLSYFSLSNSLKERSDSSSFEYQYKSKIKIKGFDFYFRVICIRCIDIEMKSGLSLFLLRPRAATVGGHWSWNTICLWPRIVTGSKVVNVYWASGFSLWLAFTGLHNNGKTLGEFRFGSWDLASKKYIP